MAITLRVQGVTGLLPAREPTAGLCVQRTTIKWEKKNHSMKQHVCAKRWPRLTGDHGSGQILKLTPGTQITRALTYREREKDTRRTSMCTRLTSHRAWDGGLPLTPRCRKKQGEPEGSSLVLERSRCVHRRKNFQYSLRFCCSPGNKADIRQANRRKAYKSYFIFL